MEIMLHKGVLNVHLSVLISVLKTVAANVPMILEVPPSTCSNTIVYIASAQHSEAAAVPIKTIKKKTIIFSTTQQSSLLNEIQKSW